MARAIDTLWCNIDFETEVEIYKFIQPGDGGRKWDGTPCNQNREETTDGQLSTDSWTFNIHQTLVIFHVEKLVSPQNLHKSEQNVEAWVKFIYIYIYVMHFKGTLIHHNRQMSHTINYNQHWSLLIQQLHHNNHCFHQYHIFSWFSYFSISYFLMIVLRFQICS